MLAYILRRCGQSVLVLLGVTILVFGMEHLLPGGPVRAILGFHANPASVVSFKRQYGLDRPLPAQYLSWLGQLIHGNLGYSYKQGESVRALVAQALPNTLILVGVSMLLAIAIGVPVGVFQASRRNCPDDYAVSAVALVLYSMPSFLLGVLLIVVFSIALPVFPALGPDTQEPLLSQIPNLVLPIMTLTLVNVALFSRYARSSTIEALLAEYVRTAKAKGAAPRRVLVRHAARNALLPVVTLLGLNLPAVVGGAVIVESIFNYPGMGLLFWKAATNEDFPVMLGVSVVVGVGVILGSLVADIMYAVIDPRIRY